jgi:hypothetical protein
MFEPTRKLFAKAKEINATHGHAFESLQLAAAELGVQTRLAASARLQGRDPAEHNRQIIGRLYEKYGYLLETPNLKGAK